jgi:hypothetical protein
MVEASANCRVSAAVAMQWFAIAQLRSDNDNNDVGLEIIR